jgi:hypothetical protein
MSNEERLEKARPILESLFYGNSYHSKEAMCHELANVLNILYDIGIQWSPTKFRATKRFPAKGSKYGKT